MALLEGEHARTRRYYPSHFLKHRDAGMVKRIRPSLVPKLPARTSFQPRLMPYSAAIHKDHFTLAKPEFFDFHVKNKWTKPSDSGPNLQMRILVRGTLGKLNIEPLKTALFADKTRLPAVHVL